MRKYQVTLPDDGGFLEIPADTLEKIAHDVRAFDKSLSEPVRHREALGKLTDALESLMPDNDAERRRDQVAERLTIATELLALGSLGFTYEQLRETFWARSLIYRYELNAS
jgi:hypothetical protein